MFRTNMRVCVLLLVIFLLNALPLQMVIAATPQLSEAPLIAKKPKESNVKPLHKIIDEQIQSEYKDQTNSVSTISSDGEFLRRVYLDLTGRTPSITQTREFLNDSRTDKRAILVDQLLASAEYARYTSQQLDVMLMRRLRKKYINVSTWEEYLRKSVADNKPLDQIVREIFASDGSNKETQAAARFYLARAGDVNELTRDIGKIFLGADLTCAQCHDHPDVNEWKQDHYYGISAFLIRSFVFTDKKKKQTVFAEKAEGEVKFESVFEVRDKTSKGAETTLPVVFNGPKISEPAFKKGEEYQVKPAKDVRPIPKYSRRAQLGVAITAPQNRRFARTMANRLWAMMLGRGIVHPLDADHSDNPPSHPQLLEILTDQMISHQFDLKWYLREIVLSETYQRSSANDLFTKKSSGKLDDSRFTHAIMKPLTPEQFSWAVLQATGYADIHRKSLKNKLTEESLRKRLLGYEKRFVTLFGGLPGKPVEGFETTADQILYLSNDGGIQGLVMPSSGNTADRVLKVPVDQPDKIAEELYLSVLNRHPDQTETEEVAKLLQGKAGVERSQMVSDLVWALVMSSEFRFNH
ncbi:MAG: DUF1549 and DUF1553 domain-containing protein [Planctomycetes bacterium]|nr:DUF1549 and DUF1553 domain-containing protein [Planctomycetota bacterium]MCH9727081.1 DUF1549 and DUF1553 domain-containing protein [Planctomycetota bacterium]MCH9775024.1 DUF1549 and DUF1553 domain-containing protein [Planctomycetota bacterium]MCH9792083.1 DUF1549 and DUF1553 domain-containing protein [Planctomycetota bacterium]